MLGEKKIIFFDFSFSNTISVAIANERKKEIEAQNSASSEKFYGAKFIAEVVNSVMKVSGSKFEQLGKIVIARGPGSFTALRALIAYVQGISFALKIPIYTTLTFRWIALFLGEFFNKETINFHLFSGKKNIFYCAEYELDIDEGKEIKIKKERIFLCEGENLTSSLDIERVVPAELGAKYLKKLFFAQLDLFDFFSPDQIHKIKPEYLMEVHFKKSVFQ
jgi:tRNA A37 threonylcarbamoyladenosine modification protein TsaB